MESCHSVNVATNATKNNTFACRPQFVTVHSTVRHLIRNIEQIKNKDKIISQLEKELGQQTGLAVKLQLEKEQLSLAKMPSNSSLGMSKELISTTGNLNETADLLVENNVVINIAELELRLIKLETENNSFAQENKMLQKRAKDVESKMKPLQEKNKKFLEKNMELTSSNRTHQDRVHMMNEENRNLVDICEHAKKKLDQLSHQLRCEKQEKSNLESKMKELETLKKTFQDQCKLVESLKQSCTEKDRRIELIQHRKRRRRLLKSQEKAKGSPCLKETFYGYDEDNTSVDSENSLSSISHGTISDDEILEEVTKELIEENYKKLMKEHLELQRTYSLQQTSSGQIFDPDRLEKMKCQLEADLFSAQCTIEKLRSDIEENKSNCTRCKDRDQLAEMNSLLSKQLEEYIVSQSLLQQSFKETSDNLENMEFRVLEMEEMGSKKNEDLHEEISQLEKQKAVLKSMLSMSEKLQSKHSIEATKLRKQFNKLVEEHAPESELLQEKVQELQQAEKRIDELEKTAQDLQEKVICLQQENSTLHDKIMHHGKAHPNEVVQWNERELTELKEKVKTYEKSEYEMMEKNIHLQESLEMTQMQNNHLKARIVDFENKMEVLTGQVKTDALIAVKQLIGSTSQMSQTVSSKVESVLCQTEKREQEMSEPNRSDQHDQFINTDMEPHSNITEDVYMPRSDVFSPRLSDIDFGEYTDDQKIQFMSQQLSNFHEENVFLKNQIEQLMTGECHKPDHFDIEARLDQYEENADQLQEKVYELEINEKQLKDKLKLAEYTINDLESAENVAREKLEIMQKREGEAKRQIVDLHKTIREMKDIVVDKDFIESSLKEKLQCLEGTNKLTSQRVAELEDTIEMLEDQLRLGEEQTADKKQMVVVNLHRNIKILSGDNEILKGKILELEENEVIMRNNWKEAAAEDAKRQERLMEKMKNLEMRNKDLKVRLVEQQEECVVNLNVSNVSLASELSALHSSDESTVSSLKQQISDLQQQVEENSDESLKLRVDELEKESDRKTDIIENLQEKMADLKENEIKLSETLSEMEHLERQLKSKLSLYENKQVTVEHLLTYEDKLKEYASSQENLLDRIDSLEDHEIDMQDTLEKGNKQFEKKFAVLEKEITENEKLIQMLENENKDYEEKVNEMTSGIQKLDVSNAKLLEEIMSLEHKIASNSIIVSNGKEEIEKREKHEEELMEKIQHLESTVITGLQNEKTQLQREKTQTKNQNSHLSHRNGQLNKDIAQLEQDKLQLDQQNNELSQNNADIMEEKDQLEQDKIQFDQKCSQLGEQNTQLAQQNAQRSTEKLKLEKDLKLLQEKIEVLTDAESKLMEKVDDLESIEDHLRHEVQRLKRQLALLDTSDRIDDVSSDSGVKGISSIDSHNICKQCQARLDNSRSGDDNSSFVRISHDNKGSDGDQKVGILFQKVQDLEAENVQLVTTVNKLTVTDKQIKQQREKIKLLEQSEDKLMERVLELEEVEERLKQDVIKSKQCSQAADMTDVEEQFFNMQESESVLREKVTSLEKLVQKTNVEYKDLETSVVEKDNLIDSLTETEKCLSQSLKDERVTVNELEKALIEAEDHLEEVQSMNRIKISQLEESVCDSNKQVDILRKKVDQHKKSQDSRQAELPQKSEVVTQTDSSLMQIIPSASSSPIHSTSVQSASPKSFSHSPKISISKVDVELDRDISDIEHVDSPSDSNLVNQDVVLPDLIRHLQTENTSLQSQLMSSETKVSTLSNSLSKSELKLVQLSKEMNDKHLENSQLLEKCSQLSKDVDSFKQNNSKLTDNLEELKQKAKLSEIKVKELSSKNSQLESSIKSLTGNLSSKQERSDGMDKAQYGELLSKLNEYSNMLSEQTSHVSSLEEENAKLLVQQQANADKLKGLSSHNSKLSGRLSENERLINVLQALLDKLPRSSDHAELDGYQKGFHKQIQSLNFQGEVMQSFRRSFSNLVLSFIEAKKMSNGSKDPIFRSEICLSKPQGEAKYETIVTKSGEEKPDMLEKPEEVLQKQAKELLKTEAYLKQHVSDLERDRDKLHQITNKDKNIIHEQNVRIRELELVEKTVKTQIAQLEASEATLYSQADVLKDKLGECEDRIRELEVIEGRLRQLVKKYKLDEELLVVRSENMETTVGELSVLGSSLKSQVIELEGERSGLSKKSDNLEARVKELEMIEAEYLEKIENYEGVQNQIKHLESSESGAVGVKAQLEITNSKMTADVHRLMEENTAMSYHISQLEGKIQDSERDMQMSAELQLESKIEAENAMQKENQLNKKVKELQIKNIEVQGQVRQMEQDEIIMKDKVGNLQRTVNKLTYRIQELESSDLENAPSQLSPIGKLPRNLEDCQKRIIVLQKDNKDLKSQIIGAKGQISGDNDTITIPSEEFNKLTAKVAEAEHTVLQLREANQFNSNLRESVADFCNRKDSQMTEEELAVLHDRSASSNQAVQMLLRHLAGPGTVYTGQLKGFIKEVLNTLSTNGLEPSKGHTTLSERRLDSNGGTVQSRSQIPEEVIHGIIERLENLSSLTNDDQINEVVIEENIVSGVFTGQTKTKNIADKITMKRSQAKRNGGINRSERQEEMVIGITLPSETDSVGRSQDDTDSDSSPKMMRRVLESKRSLDDGTEAPPLPNTLPPPLPRNKNDFVENQFNPNGVHLISRRNASHMTGPLSQERIESSMLPLEAIVDFPKNGCNSTSATSTGREVSWKDKIERIEQQLQNKSGKECQRHEDSMFSRISQATEKNRLLDLSQIENKQLKDEMNRLEQEIEVKNRYIKLLEDLVSTLEKLLKDKGRKRDSEVVEGVQKCLNKSQASIKQAKHKSALTDDVASLKTALDRKERELTVKRNEVTGLMDELKQWQNECEDIDGMRSNAIDSLRALQYEVVDFQDLDKQLKVVQDENKSLKEQLDEIENEKNKALTSLAPVRTKVARLLTKCQDKDEVIKRLIKEIRQISAARKSAKLIEDLKTIEESLLKEEYKKLDSSANDILKEEYEASRLFYPSNKVVDLDSSVNSDSSSGGDLRELMSDSEIHLNKTPVDVHRPRSADILKHHDHSRSRHSHGYRDDHSKFPGIGSSLNDNSLNVTFDGPVSGKMPDSPYFVAVKNYTPELFSRSGRPRLEIPLKEGDKVKVTGPADDHGYYEAEVNGKVGLVPANYLHPVPSSMANGLNARLQDRRAKQLKNVPSYLDKAPEEILLMHKQIQQAATEGAMKLPTINGHNGTSPGITKTHNTLLSSPKRNVRTQPSSHQPTSPRHQPTTPRNNTSSHHRTSAAKRVTGSISPPSNLQIEKIVGDNGIMLSWQVPSLDDHSRNNGVQLVGYRILVDNRVTQQINNVRINKSVISNINIHSAHSFTIQSVAASGSLSKSVYLDYEGFEDTSSEISDAESDISLSSVNFKHGPQRLFVGLYDYIPSIHSPRDHQGSEIPFRAGDVIVAYGKQRKDGFYHGEIDGKRGLVPASFIEEIPPSSQRSPGESVMSHHSTPNTQDRKINHRRS